MATTDSTNQDTRQTWINGVEDIRARLALARTGLTHLFDSGENIQASLVFDGVMVALKDADAHADGLRDAIDRGSRGMSAALQADEDAR